MSQLQTITAYDDFRAKLAEVKDTCNFIPDTSSKDGYDKSKRVALDVGKVLTAIEKTRKDLKADSLARGRAIDDEAKGIKAELEELQLPHKDAYKELDNLKKEREANRVAALEERVRVIRELPEAMADSDSEGVKMAMESLSLEECEDFYEFTQQALKARNASKAALGDMFAAKLQAEKDAAELAELRKKQAEQEQKDRDDAIAAKAREDAEALTKKAEHDKQEAIYQAAKAVEQREQAEAKAKQDAIDAKAEQAERDIQAAISADLKAKQAVEAEQQRIANEKAEEQAAQTKREANTRHISKIRGEAKESIMALGIDEATAKKVVIAIHKGNISNVSISF